MPIARKSLCALFMQCQLHRDRIRTAGCNGDRIAGYSFLTQVDNTYSNPKEKNKVIIKLVEFYTQHKEALYLITYLLSIYYPPYSALRDQTNGLNS